MTKDTEQQEALRLKIESMIGLKPKTPRDFNLVSANVIARTKKYISATTVKRFWGYIEKDNTSQMRESTLDILSEFVGYVSWQAFCNRENKPSNSDFLDTKELLAKDLQIGTVVRLLWLPDRCVTVRYEGSDVFTVIESVNSKLPVGATFHCSNIVEKQPLVLAQLTIPNMQPCSYICGKDGGVTYEIQ